MQTGSNHAAEIARLKDETRLAIKKRYRGIIGVLLGGAGIAASLAGLPLEMSLGFWGLGLASWAILKAA
jgi:hypothetical protein